MLFNRALTFLFAVFLILFLVLPQNVEAQENPHRTEHLKSWSEIDFSENSNIQVRNKNAHCLIAEVTNIPGRTRFLAYLNAEYATGRAVVTDRMNRAANACEHIIRDIIGRSHAVTFFGTDNSVPNQQSANRPLSETTAPAREQSNDFRLAQLRANTGRNLVVSTLADITLKNAGNYVPAKYQTETVSAPDSLQQLDNLSDRASLEFRKSFFIMAEIYESGAPDKSAFEDRISAMKESVNRRFNQVHARIDSLGREHKRTRQLATANADSIDAVRGDLQDIRQSANSTESSPELGIFFGAGGERFAGVNALVGEVGLRLGDAEAIGWYGRRQNVGTADLQDGPVTIHRETYGFGLNWYPFEVANNRLEFGPSVAFEHGEDYLDGREKYVRGYESGQFGVAVNARLIGPISLHGGVRYLIAQNFESTDLRLDHESSKVRAGITLRITF